MRIKNEKGVILILSFMVITILLIFGSIFIFRSITEKNISDIERALTQAFYLADGGSHEALNQMDTLINTYMMQTVNNTNPQVISQAAQGYVNSRDGIGLLIDYGLQGGTPEFELDDTRAIHRGDLVTLEKGNYRYDISITEKSDPVAMTQDVWEFPYYYRIETTGTAKGVTRKIVLTGDFTVHVQRDNFARFALFTNHHTTPNGTKVWFTDKTNFAGPVHTNERYNFAFNPGAIFDGLVEQRYTTARFYNDRSPRLIDADDNPPEDVPIFNAGFNRGVDEIVLNSSVSKQDLIDESRGGDTTPGNGIFIANNGSDLTGGVYINGDSSISMGTIGSDTAFYAITQGATTKIIRVDVAAEQTSVETVGVGTETFNGMPDGISDLGIIVYANGAITSLGGIVQGDTELTISSEDEIIITDNILYTDYTPAVGDPGDIGYIPPNAQDATNLLGLVSWEGNVRIGTSAPDDINVHGSIMASSGIFTVDNYGDTDVGSRGTATLLGGVISEHYGAFGRFNGRTGQMRSGYGRNFVYDERMLAGKSPPYFPSMRTFIAFTNDLTDKITWTEGGF